MTHIAVGGAGVILLVERGGEGGRELEAGQVGQRPGVVPDRNLDCTRLLRWREYTATIQQFVNDMKQSTKRI